MSRLEGSESGVSFKGRKEINCSRYFKLDVCESRKT